MSVTADSAERQRPGVAIPVWFIVLFVIALYGSLVYFDLHAGWFYPQVYEPYTSLADLDRFQPHPPEGDFDPGRGRALFEANCALCHNTDGAGKPGQGPPLAGSEWAAEGPNRMIRIPQNGLTGPVKVKGQDYNLSMANMGATLSDDDLANVLSHIRTSWGNTGGPITPDQVKAVRAQIGNRNQPWTAPELLALPPEVKP
jgi:mono/diheme cytochrome c family protein